MVDRQTQEFFKSLGTSLRAKDWRSASSLFDPKSCFFFGDLELWSKNSDEVCSLLEKWMMAYEGAELVDIKFGTISAIHEPELHVLDIDLIFSSKFSREMGMPAQVFLKLKDQKISLYYLALTGKFPLLSA